jgi:LPS sulfotransferase NodH
MSCLRADDLVAGKVPAFDVLIVYAPLGEEKELSALRKVLPGVRIVGIGADVLPALAARRTPLDHADPPIAPPCESLVVVLSTPRSGSSHLADVLREIGLGDCREHLRGDLVKALTSGYHFDEARALRLFLFLLGQSNKARAATKLILGHLVAWLDTRPDLRPLRAVLQDITVQVITTDRADRVAQAVSGTIAERSGVWQNRTEDDARRIQSICDSEDVFPTLFWRYQSYSRQGHLLAVLKDWGLDSLHLDYDRDIAGVPSAQLAERLCKRFGWSLPHGGYAPARTHTRPMEAAVSGAFQTRLLSGLDGLGIGVGQRGDVVRLTAPAPVDTVPDLVLIGFNKCGTSSLTDLFRRCGHTGAHWRSMSGQFLAPLIFANLHLGRPLFHGLTDYRVLSDLFYLDERVYLEANSLFELMADQYPNMRFLLNTRDLEDWIVSRVHYETPGAGRMIDRACKFFGMSAAQVITTWRDQWNRHHDAVRAHFHDKPERMLEYHIDRDVPDLIAGWLGPEWNIDPTRLRHLNRSVFVSAAREGDEGFRLK